VDKNLFFHLLDLTVLNNYIILSSCSGRIDHPKFCLSLVQKLLEMRTREPHPHSTKEEGQSHRTVKMTHCEAQQFEHWPVGGSHLPCCMCLAKKKQMTLKFQCLKCKVSLYRSVLLYIVQK
jgi:hypothetical protein